MPDFDIDFCMDRRDEVISYVQQKYGKDRVVSYYFWCHAFKDGYKRCCRVLQMPYGQVDKLAKMIPTDGVKPLSIEEALKEEKGSPRNVKKMK